MAAGFVLGRWTIPPGNHVLSFSFSWPPGQNPNKGPVFCMLSPDHPTDREDVKLTIDGYAQARSIEGPVYYYGLISNSCSQPHRHTDREADELGRCLAHDPAPSCRTRYVIRIGCHAFRATGIMAYLEAGGSLENAQAMAAHEARAPPSSTIAPATRSHSMRSREYLSEPE